MLLIFIFLSLILGAASAVPQDMTGKMLVFPQETSTAHVRLTTATQNLGAATVCLRYFTDLTRETTFFSLATPSHFNDFLIFKNSNGFLVYIRNIAVTFTGMDFQLNRWQSLCATWNAASGLAQLWLDGKPSSLKFVTTSNISGAIVMVLGQDQDSFGGGFVATESFVGMISDVHMWDHLLTPCEIENYSRPLNFPAGNIINWNSIDFQITGRVLVQKQRECF